MTEKRNQPEPISQPSLLVPRPHVIDAAQLFRGAREVWIELAGVRYRLRITRRNKLILQK